MFRTHHCGELRLTNAGQTVTLCGWIQRLRDKGGMIWIDLRDRSGITQLVFEEGSTPSEIIQAVKNLGREFIIQARGEVIERISKNPKLPTGEIEIRVNELQIINKSEIPPFTIEDESDGGDELRMKYRYLDLRRKPLQENMMLRHRMAQEIRKYLDEQHFIEIETPVLIKSTPEGARDFVVPFRGNPGDFYALPQSPQLFKQLLMIAGFEKYFQIVKCFRDEDLRADRQPEFTQIDCEMSFVKQEDILDLFEGLIKYLFAKIKSVDFSGGFPRMPYTEAINSYGSDKPDLRFDMKLSEITQTVKGFGFKVFDDAEMVGGICAKGCSEYTRKQIDELTAFVKRPQVGATGMIYVRYGMDGTLKSSVDKFYSEPELKKWAEMMHASPGDILLILAGNADKTRKALCELRLEMGTRLGLRKPDHFVPLWVVDFPLFEWDEETKRLYAKHHPFTAPKTEDISLLDSDPVKARANAYDLVINGVEIGGGSIRIFEGELQRKMFEKLGFTKEQAEKQFGFLINAFRYGAPPHGGIAFGFDRMVSLFAGIDSIRDVIAFPKNNSGKDMMIDSPATISEEQLAELHLKVFSPDPEK